MLGDIILGLPILCLLGGILYCGAHLWQVYRNEIYSWANSFLKKIGLWKTGMGRLIRLKQYSCYYILSTILSLFISVAISWATEAGVIEQFISFVKSLSIEVNKFLTTVGFAVFTVVVSLLMYDIDFSKIDREVSKTKKLFLEHLFCEILPTLIWVLVGGFVYKDYFFRTVHEWSLSPGGVFHLCWGCVSLGIFGVALFNNIQDMQKHR